MFNGFVTRPLFDVQGLEMKRETQERGLGLKCSLVCSVHPLGGNYKPI